MPIDPETTKWMHIMNLRWPTLLLAILVSACDSPSDSGDGPTPASYTIVGDAQRAQAGATLPDPIRVRALDATGRPVSGVTLGFSVTAGGGSVSAPTSLTDADGYASVYWTLGTRTRDQQRVEVVWVDAANVAHAAAVFTATALPGPPVNAIDLSTGQTAPVGAAPVDSVKVFLSDQYGNPAAGAVVTWTVIGGGGSVSPPTSIADSAGIARTRWTSAARPAPSSCGPHPAPPRSSCRAPREPGLRSPFASSPAR